MSLVGRVDGCDDESRGSFCNFRGRLARGKWFRIGSGATIDMPENHSGVLHLAPNDLGFMLFNNRGQLKVFVKRLQ